MPYTQIKGQRIANRVRRMLAQDPLFSEDVEKGSDLLGSATDRFSDDELIDYINDAQREVAAVSKGMHVHQAIVTETPAASPASPTGATILRHLPSRTFVDGVRARFLQKDTRNRIRDGGRVGSADRPIHSYENGELTTDPEPTTNISWSFVSVPEPIGALSETLSVDERFEEAIAHFVLSMCYRKLRRNDMQAAAMQRFQWFVSAFTLDLVSTVINNKEVEVE